MRQRGRDEGGSQRRPVMGRIEGESPTDDIPSPRKRADFPRVFRHERTLANRPKETSRYVGGSNACWCGSQVCARLALHRLEESLADSSSAPGAYREGCCTGQVE